MEQLQVITQFCVAKMYALLLVHKFFVSRSFVKIPLTFLR